MKLSPGIYPDMTEEAYHADPCPVPSLNQTTAKCLLNRSPLHAWHQHPRLNPEYKPEEGGAFDLGNVAHRLLLGKGRDIHRITADNYRTKEAQVAKARAYSAGAIPCLERQFQEALMMRDRALEQLRAAGIDWLPETHPDAETELAMCWNREATWFRTKVDRIQPGWVIDYKTTGGVCDPAATMTRMMSDGWYIQAAMHEAACLELHRSYTLAWRHLFVQQETAPPYALGVWEMPESCLHMGRADLELAIKVWEECIKLDTWPSYNTNKIGLLQAPVWGINQWQTRHAATLATAAE